MEVLPAALAAMADYRQFIVCLFVPNLSRPGKTDKFPVDWRTGTVASAHDSAIWLTHDEARVEALARGPDHGVGFVLTAAAGFWFLDIDNCLTPAGTWSPLALDLCQRLSGAAVEVSHSGRGLHIFGRGDVPEHGCKNTALGLELYHDGRFVALGRDAVGDAGHTTPGLSMVIAQYFPPSVAGPHGADWRTEPVPEWSGPADDAALIARAQRAVSAGSAFGSRATFADLWVGNVEALARVWPSQSGDDYDRSSADAALASHLAYWTGNNHDRILRLMRESGLSRPKWEREAYLEQTISFSCARQTRWLSDRPATSSIGLGPAPALPGPAAPGSFAAAASGVIPPTLVNLQAALRSDESGVKLRYDTFLDRIMIGELPLKDTDYIKLRTSFEERGFKSVSADLMRDAIRVVAADNIFDSAIEWASSLTWDGIPRIETSMSVYFGAEDNQYTRAVGRYLFSALAGRALDPGCQADMALIFVDTQGTRKTSAVRALAPSIETFGKVDLGKVIDDDGVSARRLRGKLVVELGELRGLATKDDEAVKDWISQRTEAWTPKYVEFETRYERRCVCIATSNRDDLLTDPTGNRRWLPLRTGLADDPGVERDRDQLWAEGVALWRASGIAWQDAERLAKGEHDSFRQTDVWEEIVRTWLITAPPLGSDGVPRPPPGVLPIVLHNIMTDALRLSLNQVGRREELRVGRVLKALNYTKIDKRINGVMTKVWVKE